MPRARVAIAAIGVAACSLVLGCESIDPTVQSFPIAFENDLSTPATLKSCDDDDCHSFRDEWQLEPGGEATDNISDRGVYTTWQVETEAGPPRCLAVEFDGTYDDVVVYLSQATRLPCRDVPLGAADVRHGGWRGHQ